MPLISQICEKLPNAYFLSQRRRANCNIGLSRKNRSAINSKGIIRHIRPRNCRPNCSRSSKNWPAAPRLRPGLCCDQRRKQRGTRDEARRIAANCRWKYTLVPASEPAKVSRFLFVWCHEKIAIQNYRLERVCGHSWVRYPMDMMLGWVLVVLIIGCVVVYGVRTQTVSDRPSEPRRRRPF